jgi:hypothetical protein
LPICKQQYRWSLCLTTLKTSQQFPSFEPKYGSKLSLLFVPFHHISTFTMAANLSLSPEEARDRIAIRQVIDQYAHCADRRLLEEQMSLFTDKTNFLVYMQGEGTSPSQVVEKREDLRPVFEFLRGFTHTTHFNGQSTIDIGPDGRTASGETYCIAYHLSDKDGHRQM